MTEEIAKQLIIKWLKERFVDIDHMIIIKQPSDDPEEYRVNVYDFTGVLRLAVIHGTVVDLDWKDLL